jgi:phosphate-selective porin OprO/OprP
MPLKRTLLALAIGLAVLPAHAANPRDPTTLELLARIAALEERLAAVEGHYETTQVAEVHQRLRVVERRQELQAEADAARATTATTLALDAGKGLSVKAPGGLEVKLRGLLQGDARFFANGSSQNDGFLLRRVEPTIEGSWGIASFRITPQLAGDSATINDAYIDLKFDPRASVRIGKAKAPFGLERLQSSASTAQVELGLPSELAPGRDIGVQLSGDVAGGALNYGIGVYNGAVDGRDGLTANPDGEFEYVGRLFWEPFKNSASNAGTLGIGVAASVGDTVGSGNNFLPRYRTPGQEQFFGYGSNIAADGERLRKTVQCYYYRGTFGVLGEWIDCSTSPTTPPASSTRNSTRHSPQIGRQRPARRWPSAPRMAARASRRVGDRRPRSRRGDAGARRRHRRASPERQAAAANWQKRACRTTARPTPRPSCSWCARATQGHQGLGRPGQAGASG